MNPRRHYCIGCFPLVCTECWTRPADSPFYEKQVIAYVRWLAKRDRVLIAVNMIPHVYWSMVYVPCDPDGKPYARLRAERRARSVAWGHEVDVYAVRKDGRRGRHLGRQFTPHVEIPIPDWDFVHPVPAREVV